MNLFLCFVFVSYLFHTHIGAKCINICADSLHKMSKHFCTRFVLKLQRSLRKNVSRVSKIVKGLIGLL